MESSREHLLFGELRNPGDLEIAGLTRAEHGRWRDFELKLVVSQSRLQKRERPLPPGGEKRILNEWEIPGSVEQILNEQEIPGSVKRILNEQEIPGSAKQRVMCACALSTTLHAPHQTQK
jgi:hypothetical protein